MTLAVQYNFQMTPNRLRVEYATIMTDIGKDMLQRLLCYDPKKACLCTRLFKCRSFMKCDSCYF
jgi:hypothetical protein